jgi:hypothetical protein
MARYVQFLRFEATHNMLGFPVIFCRKFETKRTPKIRLTEFAVLLPGL